MDDIKKKEIVAIAESWIGTRYVYNTCKKGSGVDCAKFIVAVYQEAGIISKGYRPPPQFLDWNYGKRVDKDFFINEINKFAYKISYDDKEVGDIISFMYNGIESHLAILVDTEWIIHAEQANKVCKRRFRNFRQNIKNVYRANE